MLRALAYIKTDSSYQLIARLIREKLPTDGSATRFMYPMHDSLQLTKTIFPVLLKHIGDSLFSLPFAYLQQAMLDSNLMKPADLSPYKKAWMDVAKKRINDMSEDDVDYNAGFD